MSTRKPDNILHRSSLPAAAPTPRRSTPPQVARCSGAVGYESRKCVGTPFPRRQHRGNFMPESSRENKFIATSKVAPVLFIRVAKCYVQSMHHRRLFPAFVGHQNLRRGIGMPGCGQNPQPLSTAPQVAGALYLFAPYAGSHDKIASLRQPNIGQRIQ